MRLNSIKWKPLKWWLLAFIVLWFTIWLSSGYLPAQASPNDPAIFKVGGDLVVPESRTVQDAFTIGGDVTVQEGVYVEGDVFAIGGNVQLEENVQVDGDAFAIGGQVIRSETAVINGSEFTFLEHFSNMFQRFGIIGTLYLWNVLFWFVSFVLAAIAGVLLLLLLPGHIDAIAATVQTRPFTSLIYGIGGILGLTILAVFLAGSVLGAILLPLLNLAVLLTGLFGGTSICVWLGKRLRNHDQHAYFQQFWVGLVLLFILSFIPIAGGLLISFMAFFGFGATLLARYGTQSADTIPAILDRLEHQPE